MAACILTCSTAHLTQACLLLLTAFSMSLLTVEGQRTAAAGRGEPHGRGDEPSRAEISDWMNHMETMIRGIHDSLHVLMEKMDSTPRNGPSYECPWLSVTNADVKHVFMNFVNVSCLHGFSLDAERSWVIMQCRPDGTWSPAPTTQQCIRVTCPSLRSFTNANLDSTQVSYDTKVNVSCERGYFLKGNSNWMVTQCNADQTWSPAPPNCTRAIPGIPTLVHAFHGSNPVGALALLGNELFITRRGLNYVSVHDSASFQLKRQITIPGLLSIPAGLAACPVNNYLYVSDFDSRCVHRVDLSTDIVTRWPVDFKPAGLSISRKNNNVFVAAWDETASFYEYNPAGSLVRATKDGNHVWHAVELNRGVIAITRGQPIHGVAHWTANGRSVERIYGNTLRGSGPGQMFHPRSLAADSEDNIIVTDAGNDRIEVLDGSLKNARLLPINIVLHHPIAICYDERMGRLFIGEHAGSKRLLVFDNVTNLGAMCSRNS